MLGSFSVRSCTAQSFATALPTRSSSFSGTEDKAVLGKRPGYLFKVRSLRIQELCIAQCRASEICAYLGCASENRGSPAPGTAAVCVLQQKRLAEVPFFLTIVVVPSSSPLLLEKPSPGRSHLSSVVAFVISVS